MTASLTVEVGPTIGGWRTGAIIAVRAKMPASSLKPIGTLAGWCAKEPVALFAIKDETLCAWNPCGQALSQHDLDTLVGQAEARRLLGEFGLGAMIHSAGSRSRAGVFAH